MNRLGKTITSAVAAVAVAGGGAAAIIMKWEGKRFEPYRDPVGILTVCYGHTGADVIAGKRYTQAECDALLHADMAIARAHVRRCLPLDTPPHVEDALTSATFNIGPRVVCGSTLQRKALAGDWPGACAELSRWNRAGGRVLRGLTLRRIDERAMCEGRGQ